MIYDKNISKKIRTKKSLVIIDRSLELVNYILLYTNYNIACLIVDTEEQRNYCLNEIRIAKIYLSDELLDSGDLKYLTREKIDFYKYLQGCIESVFTRASSNYQEKKYQYYVALNFWESIFENNDIAMVFVNGLNHGSVCDGIPLELAKQKNILSYTMEYDIENYRYLLRNKEEFVSINRILQNNNKISKIPLIDNTEKEGWFKKFNNYGRDFSYSIGGVVFKGFCSVILKRKQLVMKNKLFSVEYTFTQQMKSFCSLKKTLYFLKKHSVEIDQNEKYIFFSLYFDPDAAGNSVRHILDSQLVAIRMLAENLPEGWKLYVKDHPMYLKLNQEEYGYFIHNIELFRDNLFYKRIMDMKHVKLINIKTSSEEIIKFSQAVAMIQGSNAGLTIQHKKPLIFFSDKNPMVLSSEVFLIREYTDLKNVCSILKNGFKPSYEDIDNIKSKYLVKDDCMGRRLLYKQVFSNDLEYRG